uniref:Uncharacterized protein n=1 Tax=Arundo donax TaxID=35708 RepID=A0A0A9TC86_ARUDO
MRACTTGCLVNSSVFSISSVVTRLTSSVTLPLSLKKGLR